MNERRVGRALRAIRQARRLRQGDVAAAAGFSRATVSAIEGGRWQATTVRTLAAVFDAVGADLDVIVRYRGAELDRLLDAGHAAIVMALATDLRELGWRVEVEVSFNDFGDRGSIDLLAYHPATRTLLVIEVKTELASAEETLRRLDIKVRVAPKLAVARFGERPARVVRLLAIRASSANRARVAKLEPLLGPLFPMRGRALTTWLQSLGPSPGRGAGGLLFIRNVSRADVTNRERRVRGPGKATARLGEHDGGATEGSGGAPGRRDRA
jgi:transcriptional regulator with XRE-family HTH domain